MKKSLFVILFFLCFLQLLANDPALKIEVLKDCEEKTTEEVLVSNDFTLLQKQSFHSSPSNCDYWFKLTSNKVWNKNNYLVLGNNLNNCEEIFCLNDEKKILIKKTIGTDQFFESNTYLPSFQLNNDYKFIYIKVQSFSFLKESFSIKTSKEIHKQSASYLILYVSVIAVLLVLATYLFLLFCRSRRRIILYYVFYIVAVILASFFISNLGRYLIWDKLPFSNTYFEGAMVMFLVSFYNLFASKATFLKSWSVVFYNINLVLILSYPILFLISILIHNLYFVALISGIFPGIALLLLCVMVIQNVVNKNLNSRYFLFGFLFFFSGVVLRLLINEGLIKHTFKVEVVIFIGIVLEVFVFSYVVIHHLDKEFLKGKENEKKLINSLSVIDELKEKIQSLSDSNENHMQLISIDKSINSFLLTPLSKREIEVLNSIIKGGKYKEISEELHISINTLKTHVSRIYSKLEINNRVEAINKVTKLANRKK